MISGKSEIWINCILQIGGLTPLQHIIHNIIQISFLYFIRRTLNFLQIHRCIFLLWLRSAVYDVAEGELSIAIAMAATAI